jgi:2-polyprenyl-3-methyl-5-hydroxy-6-metoxy-1,4-benzoquinol methylase
MEKQHYYTLAQLQSSHWFYEHRRRLILENLKAHFPQRSSLSILDFGAGMGANYSVLSQFGDVTMVETESVATQYLKEQFPQAAVFQSLDEISESLKNRKFDVILISYVLYHVNVKRPEETLKKLLSLSKNGAVLIHLEPAFPSLTRALDGIVGGARRFTRHSLVTAQKTAGWTSVEARYILPSLFPVGWILARLDYLRKKIQPFSKSTPQPLEQKVHPWINRAANLWQMTVDRAARACCLPFGIGLISIARFATNESKYSKKDEHL